MKANNNFYNILNKNKLLIFVIVIFILIISFNICFKENKKPYSGKTAVFVGDSITYGEGTKEGTRYWEVLEKELDLASVTAMGVSRSCISANSTIGNMNSPLINRYKNIPEADLIIIFMGTNDYGLHTPLGTIEDNKDISFYGALNVIVSSLKQKYPKSEVIFITPMHRYGFGQSKITGETFTYDYLENDVGASLKDYSDAIKNVCNKYSIPVIDLYNLSGINPSTQTSRDNYMPDGIHPNERGHRKIADIIRNWLEEYAL